MKLPVIISIILACTCLIASGQDSHDMAYIPGGAYTPLYGAVDSEQVYVSGFYLDKTPVTNDDYLEFVKEEVAWRKSEVKGIFSETGYLEHWKGDLDPGLLAPPNAPVVKISWFAAKRYCEYQGKRLPTMDEWEFVVMASQTSTDARKDSSYTREVLSWYEAPKQQVLPNVKTNEPNIYGVYDMYGLVWEWVLDFNSVIITGESRQDRNSKDNSDLFCAGGSVSATDLMNYAAFMRYAFRGSLKARYTIKNLGFRCAMDADKSN